MQEYHCHCNNALLKKTFFAPKSNKISGYEKKKSVCLFHTLKNLEMCMYKSTESCVKLFLA